MNTIKPVKETDEGKANVSAAPIETLDKARQIPTFSFSEIFRFQTGGFWFQWVIGSWCSVALGLFLTMVAQQEFQFYRSDWPS